MTVRPLQPHGTTARARGRESAGIPRCDCVPCVAAMRHYNSRRKALAALGHPGRISAARAARHVRMLGDAGMTWRELINAAGISQGTLAKLLRDDAYDLTISAVTQARILAVPVPKFLRPDEWHVDGTGTRRRRQALACGGWSSDALAEHSVLNSERLRRLLTADRVKVATRDEVKALYARLAFVAGPSPEAGRRALRRRWMPAGAWDDATIDDPAALPDLGAPTPRPLAVAEDAEFIRRTTGVGDVDVAERMGITLVSLHKNLERAQAMAGAAA